MDGKIRVTTDTYSGKPFRWNTTAVYCGYQVPMIVTRKRSDFLHPSRVPKSLLRELNDGRSYTVDA